MKNPEQSAGYELVWFNNEVLILNLYFVNLRYVNNVIIKK
jgi:hypothetical protein